MDQLNQIGVHEIGKLSTVLLEDMELDNKIVGCSYTVRYHNFDEKKPVRHLKEKYGTNDYFPLSAVLKAGAAFNTQIASERTYKKMINKKLKNISSKIRKEAAPQYTSIIAKYKYASSKGLSGHLSATYCIARKGQGYLERIA